MTTLLAYAALVTPDPLQVKAGGTITLVVSNPGRQVVSCASIEISLPVGMSAKELMADATALDLEAPLHWNAIAAGGVVTLTPATPDDGRIAGAGLSVVITDFLVNAEPGTCKVRIVERASTPSSPVADRATALELFKFPERFHVSDLQADPLDVTAGGSTTLNWSGSDDAVYTMKYQPADAGTPVSQVVSNTGPYVAQNLTRSGAVNFTLVVQVTVAGQDEKLEVQRHAAVSIETVSITFDAAPTSVGANGLVHLQWSAPNATSCRLDPGPGTVPATGELYVVVPQTRTFTLTACGDAGLPVQQQRTVTVDPSIVPNENGWQIIGQPGTRFPDGDSSWGQPGNGVDGGNGGHAELTVTLPPLDVSSTPARVIPITLTGGNGGNGSNGGNCYGFDQGPAYEGGSAGSGGNGGNSILAATFNPASGPPAQYVITMSAGQGGTPGARGQGRGVARAGNHGTNGTLSMTFNGIP